MPIKIRRSTYRLIKLGAAWFECTAIEYIDRIVKRAVAQDLGDVSTDLRSLTGPPTPPRDKRPQ